MTTSPQGAGAGFDVFEQGLHLMPAGTDADGTEHHRGALDTSRGPLLIEITVDPSDAGRVKGIGTSGRLPERAAGPDPHPSEIIVSVEEQFVELAPQEGRLVGCMTSSIGTWRIVDDHGVFTLETE